MISNCLKLCVSQEKPSCFFNYVLFGAWFGNVCPQFSHESRVSRAGKACVRLLSLRA